MNTQAYEKKHMSIRSQLRWFCFLVGQMLESIRLAGSKKASLRPHTHRASSSCLTPLRESLYPVSSRGVPTTHWAPMTRTQSANKKSSLSTLSLSFDRTPPLSKQLVVSLCTGLIFQDLMKMNKIKSMKMYYNYTLYYSFRRNCFPE